MDFQIKVKSEPVSDEAYDDGVVIDGFYPEADQVHTFLNYILLSLRYFLYQYISITILGAKQSYRPGTLQQMVGLVFHRMKVNTLFVLCTL